MPSVGKQGNDETKKTSCLSDNERAGRRSFDAEENVNDAVCVDVARIPVSDSGDVADVVGRESSNVLSDGSKLNACKRTSLPKTGGPSKCQLKSSALSVPSSERGKTADSAPTWSASAMRGSPAHATSRDSMLIQPSRCAADDDDG